MGHKEEMQEIDIQGALTDILQSTTYLRIGTKRGGVGSKGVVHNEQATSTYSQLGNKACQKHEHATIQIGKDECSSHIEKQSKQHDGDSCKIFLLKDAIKDLLIHGADISKGKEGKVQGYIVQAQHIVYAFKCRHILRDMSQHIKHSIYQHEGHYPTRPRLPLSTTLIQHEIRGIEEQEHLKQGYSKPIAQLIGAGDKGHEVELQVGIGTKESKDESGHQLHHQLLPGHGPPRLSCPLYTCLIAYKATDEEEQGHAERDEDIIHERVLVLE